jgi:tape measure domain-containing protein
MPTLDEVTIQMNLRMDGYERDLRRAERTLMDSSRNMVGAADSLERHIRASSGQIGSSFRGLAASLAAAFSVQQITQFADAYTRFTNQLQVTGLEGSHLAQIQEQLLAIANRNGVELEAVGTLYSRAAQNSRELGASQADLIGLTSAVAASLKISGTSASAASGSLLQLGQALGSPRIQAEEFNSLLDTMQPLLREAAKHIDGTGGSLSGLTRAIKDTNGAGVSNIQLFRGILASMTDLEATAGRSGLTIAGAFQTLNNQLGNYIGQADDSLSATELISGAIVSLSKNLDAVAAALGVIAAFLVGRFAASMVGAAASTGVVSASLFAMQARAVGAATSMEALGFAGAAAGRGLLAAFGGPVGLAVTALTIGLGYLATTSNTTAQATENLRTQVDEQARALGVLSQRQAEADAAAGRLNATQQAGLAATANLTGEAGKLAEAWARVAAQAKSAALEQANAMFMRARNTALEARQNYHNARETAFQSAARRPFAERGLGRDAPATNAPEALASSERAAAPQRALYGEALRNYVAARRARDEEAQRPLTNYRPANAAAPGARSGGARGRRAGAGRSGPSAENVGNRFLDERDRLETEGLRAQADIVTDIRRRAELEHGILDIQRQGAIRAINANEQYSATRKQELVALTDRADLARRTVIDAQRDEALRQQQYELLRAQIDDEAEIVRAQEGLAETRHDRLEAELRLLDLQNELAEEAVRELAARKEITAAEAQRRQQVLHDLHEHNREGVLRSNESPAERYIRALGTERRNLDDRFEEIAAQGLDNLSDGLIDVIHGVKSLGDAFASVADQIISDLLRIAIQRAVIEPLANALFPSGQDGGLLGKLAKPALKFGGFKALGGPVSPGSAYVVGERGRELFVPDQSGVIVPSARTGVSAAANGAGGTTTVRLELSGDFEARVASVSGPIAVEVVRSAAPGLVRAASADTVRRISRRGIGG